MARRTIRLGSSGEDVLDLQTALASLRMLPQTFVTGKFSAETTRAVIRFQHEHGLIEDGLVGPLTWAALTDHVPAEMPDWGTAGPSADAHPSVVSVDGLWSQARHVPAAPGRIGPAITPRTIVVHTTDCVPGTMGSIVRSWSRPSSVGACAHFIIGRSADDGTVQMVPIYRNGNHAGGTKDGKPYHGDWSVDGKLIHPNTWAIGIELDCAGRLGKKKGGKWVHPDTGTVLADADVSVDSTGVGWHKVTEYQLETLGALLDALEPILAPIPPRTTIVPNGAYKANGVPWAESEHLHLVGHVTLNPLNKTDPGPVVMDWLDQREGKS